MADPYSMVKSGKLKLKTGKEKKSKKVKKPTVEVNQAKKDTAAYEDMEMHGGWWTCRGYSDLSGPLAIEFGNMRYLKSLDNGHFRLGDVHNPGENPDGEEILTAMRTDNNRIALKSGFNKYLGVRIDGRVVAVADAISSMEQWEPVFEDGKMALCGYNNRFLTFQDDGVYCCSTKASDKEFLQFRSCASRKKVKDKDDIDSGKLIDVEMNYVKKYQSFEDKRVRVCTEGRRVIKKAKIDGILHETLLDRREK